MNADLVSEIILRSRGRHDVVTVVNNVVSDFLDRTFGDADVWSLEHALEAADESIGEKLREYGDPSKGLPWKHQFEPRLILLPNGTQLRAQPYGVVKIAEVKRQQLWFEGAALSPSQFASRAWNNTSRSAWRDLEVKLPDALDWVPAKAL
ncbi:MAG: hypothetical protein ACHP9T_13665 [Caulobacterales bacterium]